MAKNSPVFICQSCGYRSPKWLGQCPACHQWNSLVETAAAPSSRARKTARRTITPIKIKDISHQKLTRLSTEINEVDRVLGGGVVPGQVVLFAGEPGIGKSTLLTQLSLNLNEKTKNHPVFYLCGEESPQQIKLRLRRLNINSQKTNNLLLLPETDVDAIIAFLERQSPLPSLVIIDSIQTLTTSDLTGVAGSVGQVRESSQRLINWAKTSQVPIFLVGHITKEGSIAGPKVLEHAVDTVIYFEGERMQDLRLLRVIKNRFGPTDEVGIFQMTDKGLIPFNQDLLVHILNKPRVGSASTIVSEGTRLIMVEIQALVTQSFTPISKRVITGLERNRTEMLIAVCQKQLRLPLFKYDIFINVAGGIKITEPAADLAVCAAIFSSYKNKPLPTKSCFVGEVSLLGEISPISQMDKRKKQARGLGIKTVLHNTNLPFLRKLQAYV